MVAGLSNSSPGRAAVTGILGAGVGHFRPARRLTHVDGNNLSDKRRPPTRPVFAGIGAFAPERVGDIRYGTNYLLNQQMVGAIVIAGLKRRDACPIVRLARGVVTRHQRRDLGAATTTRPQGWRLFGFLVGLVPLAQFGKHARHQMARLCCLLRPHSVAVSLLVRLERTNHHSSTLLAVCV